MTRLTNQARTSQERKAGWRFFERYCSFVADVRYRATIIAAITIGAIGMITPTDAASDGVGTNPMTYPAAPHPKFARTLDLSNVGRGASLTLMTFSPDSRYLAVVDNPNVASSTIIIWDLQLDREQTRIEVAGFPSLGTAPDVKLLWSPDGKYITFGSGRPIRFWDPMAGQMVKELVVDPPVLWSRYNKDGGKFLVNRSIIGHKGFRIYDTRSWEFQDYGDDGLSIEGLSWTADDKILVAGPWPKASVGRTLDGIVPHWYDVLARLIDPSGKQAPRLVLLSSPEVAGIDRQDPTQAFFPYHAVVNYRTNKIALGPGKIIDGRTLEILSFASGDDILSHKIPVGGQAFSADGNYLYLLGFSRDGKTNSLVVNAHTGAPAGTFPGGRNLNALAVSPDGKLLAIGNGHSVDLYDVE
jgi:WD40 repeat protein